MAAEYGIICGKKRDNKKVYMEAIFVLVMFGLIGLCVLKEIDYYSETRENKMWRLNLIWVLVVILLLPFMQSGCTQSSGRESDGHGHGWEDR